MSDSTRLSKISPVYYWRLWLLNAGLVSAGVLFLLATQYGTFDFLRTACLMALLPFIPLMVLVGGAGSTIFALTKVFVEKRGFKKAPAVALLMGPGLAVTCALVLLGLSRSSDRWLSYICAGNAPTSARQVEVSGYSTFLREDWLAVFHVSQPDFDSMIAKSKLAPADAFEFRKALETSPTKEGKLYGKVPRLNELPCFKRVFKPGEEHERGNVFAVFDPTTSTATVLRQYRD